MIAVVKAAGATVANRALQLVVQSATGILTDVYEASFQVFDCTNSTNEATPLQVYPTTGGQKQTIDTTAHKLGTGRYAAVWTSSAANLGRHMVRWFYRLTSTSPELQFDQEFELVPVAYQGPAYCTLYDLSANGFSGSTTDGSAQKLIVQASRYIEHYTGRYFYPLYKVLTIGGRAGRALALSEPIVALEGVGSDYSGVFAPGERYSASGFRVFNRHLTQNLTAPDDREYPKLEFLYGWNDYRLGRPGFGLGDAYFPLGVQNVQVSGVFGYTEADGSMTGATPHLIRIACQLLCFKQQYPMGGQARTDAMNSQRLKSEYTRDQGYIMESPTAARATPFVTHTLDPEIDAILFGFRRPPQFGAA